MPSRRQKDSRVLDESSEGCSPLRLEIRYPAILRSVNEASSTDRILLTGDVLGLDRQDIRHRMTDLARGNAAKHTEGTDETEVIDKSRPRWKRNSGPIAGRSVSESWRRRQNASKCSGETRS